MAKKSNKKLVLDFSRAESDILYRVKTSGKWSGWRSLFKTVKGRKQGWQYPWEYIGSPGIESVEWKSNRKSFKSKLTAYQSHKLKEWGSWF